MPADASTWVPPFLRVQPPKPAPVQDMTIGPGSINADEHREQLERLLHSPTPAYWAARLLCSLDARVQDMRPSSLTALPHPRIRGGGTAREQTARLRAFLEWTHARIRGSTSAAPSALHSDDEAFEIAGRVIEQLARAAIYEEQAHIAEEELIAASLEQPDHLDGSHVPTNESEMAYPVGDPPPLSPAAYMKLMQR